MHFFLFGQQGSRDVEVAIFVSVTIFSQRERSATESGFVYDLSSGLAFYTAGLASESARDDNGVE